MNNPLDHDEGDLSYTITEDESLLVVEGLHKLLAVKHEALHTVRAANYDFQPEDFGIPKIRDLIEKLGGPSCFDSSDYY